MARAQRAVISGRRLQGSRLVLGWIAVASSVIVAGGCGGGSSSSPSGNPPLLGMRLDVEDARGAAEIATAAEHAHADGVGLDLAWSDIEPNPPAADGTHTYRWAGSPFDDTVSALRDAGVKILTVRVTEAPDWASRGNGCRTKACPPIPKYYDDFRDFVNAAIHLYGPGTNADIQHWSLWNEPNKPTEWGGFPSFRQYSNLLAEFHTAAVAANGDVSVDAGEIAAGGATGDNAPRGWATRFYRFSKRRGRNADYNLVTIHAYSQDPGGVAAKLRAYQELFKGHPVAATEFGWSLGGPKHGGNWKCVPTEQLQAAKFTRAVQDVRKDPKLNSVPWLVWFAGIDDDLADDKTGKAPKCPTHTWYDQKVRPHMNAFGIYKRSRDGSPTELFPRKVTAAFTAAAEGNAAGG